MKKVLWVLFFFGVGFSLFSNVHLVHAHEVYVLNQKEISFDMLAPRPDFISSIEQHLSEFLVWGIGITVLIVVLFFISISAPLERLLDPLLLKIKKYAPHIAQVTLGLSLFASGYYHAIFGVELPLAPLFGNFEMAVSWILVVIGLMLTFGIYPRIAGVVATLFFFGLVGKFGIYMLNYFTYLGEALSIVIFGGAHTLSANKKMSSFFTKMIRLSLHEYKFLLMRIFFGISLIYASLYAKFFHGALALDVVTKYHLTHYFPFDPVFLVLGAMLVEILLGVCFLVGFEIRFASLFFLVFLTMSLFFFGEAVWPHVILIGTALAMFVHGYDRFTLTMEMSHSTRRRKMEPTL
jgi:uncharacterized membrane protein YphA (DoxX/SURF4 family)